jgi:uncharacterized protein YeaO (DUF488 family)
MASTILDEGDPRPGEPLYNNKVKHRVDFFMAIVIKRVYEPVSRSDGARVLVDRLWPRGLTKESAALDAWLRDLAPSDELRRWYHARPDEWVSFRKKYLEELSHAESSDALARLYELAHKRKRVTLLFASKNETRNNALVLKELLDGMRKPPTGAGSGGTRTAGKSTAARRR